jgi:hypothetical protein
MQHFLCKMAGADCAILEKSGEESQRRFQLIGWLFVIVVGCMLFAFFGLFWKVFDSFAVALFAALVVTFLVSSIYRLNMLSLEPPTLRDQDELKTKLVTHFIRYFSITLFAFFTAKCMEGLLFGDLADPDIVRMSDQFGLARGNLFVEHVIQLSIHHPWVWLFTAGIVLLFLLPVVLKFRLRQRKEYFSLKKAIEIRMVLTNHDACKSILEKLHRRAYAAYRPGKRLPEAPTYKKHERKYSDEPFNTKKIPDDAKYSPSTAFVHLNTWK